MTLPDPVPPNRYLLVLGRRDTAAGETAEEFMAWWRVHAQKAALIPGLSAYRVFPLDARTADDSGWDGFSLLEFAEGFDAEEQLFRSSEGKAALDDVGDRGGRRLILAAPEAYPVMGVE